MLETVSLLIIASTVLGRTTPLSIPANKISELRLYSAYDYQELTKAEGMMNEIVITAERPLTAQIDKENHKKNNFRQMTDYLTFIANALIVVFFLGVGIMALLSKWKQRKNQKKRKGPFSLPPFSNKNIDLGKDYAC